MKLTPYRLGSLLALVSLASACASSAPVGITKSEAIVAGCSKVGDVSVDKKVPEADLNNSLADEARRKGANYVVVGADGARTGTAYRCSQPPAIAGR